MKSGQVGSPSGGNVNHLLGAHAPTDVYTEYGNPVTSKTTGNNDVQTQTDAFLDRPPTPLFVPAKTGMDVATQIEEGDVSMH